MKSVYITCIVAVEGNRIFYINYYFYRNIDIAHVVVVNTAESLYIYNAYNFSDFYLSAFFKYLFVWHLCVICFSPSDKVLLKCSEVHKMWSRVLKTFPKPRPCTSVWTLTHVPWNFHCGSICPYSEVMTVAYNPQRNEIALFVQLKTSGSWNQIRSELMVILRFSWQNSEASPYSNSFQRW